MTPERVASVLCFRQDSAWTYHSKHMDTVLSTYYLGRQYRAMVTRTSSRAAAQPEVICPSGDIWQWLKIFLVDTT